MPRPMVPAAGDAGDQIGAVNIEHGTLILEENPVF